MSKVNPDSWQVVYPPLGGVGRKSVGPFYQKSKATTYARETGGKVVGKREHHKFYGRGHPDEIRRMGGRAAPARKEEKTFDLVKVGTNQRKSFFSSAARDHWLDNNTYGKQWVDRETGRWGLGSHPGYEDEEAPEHGYWETVWVKDDKPRLPNPFHKTRRNKTHARYAIPRKGRGRR